MGDNTSGSSHPYPENTSIKTRGLHPYFDSHFVKATVTTGVARRVLEYRTRFEPEYAFSPVDTSALTIPTLVFVSPELMCATVNAYLGYPCTLRDNTHLVVQDRVHVLLEEETLTFYSDPLDKGSVTYPNNLRLNMTRFTVCSELDYGVRATDAFVAFLLNFIRSQDCLMQAEAQVCPPPVHSAGQSAIVPVEIAPSVCLASCSSTAIVPADLAQPHKREIAPRVVHVSDVRIVVEAPEPPLYARMPLFFL